MKNESMRASFVISCVIILLITCFLLFGCEGPEGKQGLVGPTGEVGPPGEEGSPGEDGEPGKDAEIIPISGVVSVGDYDGQAVRIDDYRIHKGDAVLVYVTLNPESYPWLDLSNFYVFDGYIWIPDPSNDLLGWHYLILIIKA